MNTSQSSLKLKSALLIATVILGTGMSAILFTSCERKPETVGEKIKDGLDARPNEKIKDAGEDVKDAVKDAKDEIKDAVKN
jgi:hypothetical protein